MELKLPDHARRLADSIIALARKLANADEQTKNLFSDLFTELNALFSTVSHPFFENSEFSEMFADWKSMYMRTKEMLPEQQKINVLMLAKLTNNNVDKATRIVENAIRYQFLDLNKSAEKMPDIIDKPARNKLLQPIQQTVKAKEICQNPDEVLQAHKYKIRGDKIRCELVPAEKAIELRAKLNGYTITFTNNILCQ